MRKSIKIAVILCGILVLFLAATFFLVDTEVAEEFSPDKFCHRTVTYFDVVGFGRFAHDPEEWRTPIEGYLHEKGMVPPPTRQGPRWHYARGHNPPARGLIGIAYGMSMVMGRFQRDQDNGLVQWSKANPGMAALLWPEVVRLAREERYEAAAHLVKEAWALEERSDTLQDIQDLLSRHTD